MTAPAGYEFVGWDKRPNSDLVIEDNQFTMPNRDVTFYGHFEAKNNIAYKVEHYIQDVTDLTKYDINDADTENNTGTTDSTVSASPKTTTDYNGFSVDWVKTRAENTGNTVDESASKISGTVKGDGSLVIKFYYKRNEYTLNYVYTNSVADATDLPEETKYIYGKEVTVAPQATAPGYTFDGWTLNGEKVESFTMPANAVVLEGTFNSAESSYDVEFYYESNGAYSATPNEVKTRTAVTGTNVSVTTADTTPKTGYEYDRTAANVTSGTVSGYDSSQTPSGTKLALKLYFKQIFTVSYQPGEHGTFEEKIYRTIYYGTDTPSEPTVTGEDGYVFTGWNEKGGRKSDTVTDSVTYVAQWSEDKNGNNIPDEDDEFKVIYTDGVEGEEVFADDVHEGCKVGTDTPNFTVSYSRTDYVRIGWEPTVSEKIKAEDAKDSSDKLTITYKALWALDENGNGIPDSQDRFKVVYTDGVEGEEVFADQIDENLRTGDATPTFRGETPKRTDYVFDVWTPSVRQNVRAADAKDSSDKLTITYTATWKDDKNNNGIPDDEEEFTVIYKDGDTELQNTNHLSNGAPTPTIVKPTKKDYVFDNWDPEYKATVDAADANENSEIIYNATWKEDKNNNGTADEDETFTVIYKDGDTELKKVEDLEVGDTLETYTPDKDNYVFDKWTPEFKATVDAADANTDCEIIYTANWKDDKNNNNIPDDIEKFTVIYKPGEYGAFTDNQLNKTKFTGLGLNSTTPTYNGAVDGKGKPKSNNEDYVFGAWNPTRKSTVVAEDSKAPTSGEGEWEIIYNATWKEDKNHDLIPDDGEFFTVEYHKGTNGAFTENVSGKTLFGELTVNSNTPEYQGEEDANGNPKPQPNWVFGGWSPALAPTVTADEDLLDGQIDDVIVYTATWKEDKNNNGTADEDETFTVIYKDGDTELKKVEDLEVGDTLETYTPDKDNYVFDKWTPEFKATVDAADANTDCEIIYTANWKDDKNNNNIPDDIEKFTVVYMDSDKEYQRSTGLSNGASTPTIANPTKTDYVFDKWTPEVSPTIKAEQSVAPADEGAEWEIIYTANWKEDKNNNGIADDVETFTVVYKDGDTELKKFTGLSNDADTPEFNDATKPYHVFDEWTPEVSSTVKAEDSVAPSSGTGEWEIVYNANWKPKTVVLDFKDGNERQTLLSGYYGTELEINPDEHFDPDKHPNSDFVGWSEDQSASEPQFTDGQKIVLDKNNIPGMQDDAGQPEITVPLFAVWKEYEYNCTAGDEQSWYKGSNSNLTFQFKRSLRDGEKDAAGNSLSYNMHVQTETKVILDGEDLTPGNDYTIASGSLVVTLKKSLLQSLGTGKHTITTYYFDFKDGEAYKAVNADFYVKERPSGGSHDLPRTGVEDSISPMYLLPVMFSALWFVFNKKRNHNTQA